MKPLLSIRGQCSIKGHYCIVLILEPRLYGLLQLVLSINVTDAESSYLIQVETWHDALKYAVLFDAARTFWDCVSWKDDWPRPSRRITRLRQRCSLHMPSKLTRGGWQEESHETSKLQSTVLPWAPIGYYDVILSSGICDNYWMWYWSHQSGIPSVSGSPFQWRSLDRAGCPIRRHINGISRDWLDKW